MNLPDQEDGLNLARRNDELEGSVRKLRAAARESEAEHKRLLSRVQQLESQLAKEQERYGQASQAAGEQVVKYTQQHWSLMWYDVWCSNGRRCTWFNIFTCTSQVCTPCGSNIGLSRCMVVGAACECCMVIGAACGDAASVRATTKHGFLSCWCG